MRKEWLRGRVRRAFYSRELKLSCEESPAVQKWTDIAGSRGDGSRPQGIWC